MIEAQTGWRGFGVAPWFDAAWKLPAEDALDFRQSQAGGRVAHRLPALQPDRQFRRSRPADAGTGRAPYHAVGGPADPGGCRSGDPAGVQIHARRPGVPARPGLGHRPAAHHREAGMFWASAAATRCWATRSPTRRASRARPAARPGWGCSTSAPRWAATRACARSTARHIARGSAVSRLRNPHRALGWAGSRARLCPRRGRA